MKKIKSIKSIGAETVYDITVKNNRNFYTRGAILHNCDYRNEVCVIAENTGFDEIHFALGDRVAQIVLAEVPKIVWSVVESKDQLPSTDRTGGFGSTGTK